MENKGFSMNPHGIALDPDLSFRDYWVYGVLQSFRNGRTGQCNPSNAALRKKTKNKIGLTCLYESVIKLEKAGWLSVARTAGHVNRYVFPHTPIRQGEGGYSGERVPPLRQGEYKQDVVNKKYVNKGGLRFGKDPAKALPDGKVILFVPHQKRWVAYGGGDDEKFTYKNLIGAEARRAAITDTRDCGNFSAGTAETPD
ncbi:MAG: hypothetical protein AAB473_01090 [Patescibacteria group bacterium]